jgi:PAS domain S-box-containing protein
LDNATSIIIATDANGIITSFNKAGEQTLGYKAEELVGKLPPAAFHDLSEVAAYAPILSAELGEEIPIGFEVFIAKSKKGLKNIKEWTYIKKDGTKFLVELSISAIRNDENEITGYLGMATDITERKELEAEMKQANEELAASEEELKQNLEELSATQEALQNAFLEMQGQFNAIDGSMGYIEFNTQRQFTKVNKLACKLLGYEEHELKGATHSLVVPEKYLLSGEYEEFWQKLLQGQVFMQEFERIGKNGNTIWLYASYSPVLDTEGNVVKIVKLAADITEDKKLAEEIKIKNAALASSEKELRQNFEELNATQEQLKTQFDILAIKNKNIADSINYAKRIQDALLPRLTEIQSVFPDSFVFFKPRDIISGDFYWFANKGHEQIIVAADCTGHGVPGAFMSMLGSSLLNQIVHDKEIHEPNLILDLLHNGVEDMLNQRHTDSESRDGMDASICLINQGTKTIQFAGANNPMYVVAKQTLHFSTELEDNIVKVTENGEWQLTEIKGDKRPIGGRVLKHDHHNYTSKSFKINQELHIYLFSDGIIDQIGGDKRMKLMSKGFKQLILDSHEKPSHEQNKFFDTFFSHWISGTQKQLDDILVIGFKIINNS